MDLGNIGSILLLVFGFGFVIFWHELGHFLAAKWSDVKVEQFAVGFGQALISWRKGMGFRVGTSKQEYDRRVQRHLEEKRIKQLEAHEEAPAPSVEQEDRAAAELGLGETEYRLNWIPLGGYVKMLGQDDLYANADQTHPRAYNMKPIGKRMIIVSAGVVMNIILATAGFCILFLMGFRVPPAIVGDLAPLSPAQEGGMRVGDRILYYDGKYQHDFTKIGLNVALSEAGEPVPVFVRHPDGKEEHLSITPRKPDEDATGFLSIGIDGPRQLTGAEMEKGDVDLKGLVPDEMFAMTADDAVIAVNGETVDPKTDYWKFDKAVQSSGGKPVTLTVKNQKSGATREIQAKPFLEEPYGKPLNFAGMQTRVAVLAIQPESVVKGKLKPGDVVVAIANDAHDSTTDLTRQKLTKRLNEFGEQGAKVSITVLRDGQEIQIRDIVPNIRLSKGRYGLGVQLRPDSETLVVTDTLPESPAAKAGVPAGAKILSINGHAVNSWFDVRSELAKLTAGQTAQLVATVAGTEKSFDLVMDAASEKLAKNLRYGTAIAFREMQDVRHTGHPLVGAAWGVGETRDLILQFYLTIQRMIQGSVSPKNVMGPLGIVSAGTKFAYKGNDWLIWFLSMISAILAVVNFLPIPIVDGGLFVFLILEKLQGKPLSQRAQSIAQVIGLALILSVFLFVTYQDIARMRGF
jgi:regulator of sigma E protease